MLFQEGVQVGEIRAAIPERGCPMLGGACREESETWAEASTGTKEWGSGRCPAGLPHGSCIKRPGGSLEPGRVVASVAPVSVFAQQDSLRGIATLSVPIPLLCKPEPPQARAMRAAVRAAVDALISEAPAAAREWLSFSAEVSPASRKN